MKALGVLLSLIAVSAFAGVTKTQPLPNFVELLHDTESMVVYEGLPHLFEKEVRAHEQRTKKTFSVSTELFYAKTLPVTEEDTDALDHAFRTIALFVPFRGEKLCGGFHADYLIEWRRKGERLVAVLVCFGCGEVRIMTAEQAEQYDMSAIGRDFLSSVLIKYRQERPEFKIPAQNQPAEVKSTPHVVAVPEIKWKVMETPPLKGGIKP